MLEEDLTYTMLYIVAPLFLYRCVVCSSIIIILQCNNNKNARTHEHIDVVDMSNHNYGLYTYIQRMVQIIVSARKGDKYGR